MGHAVIGRCVRWTTPVLGRQRAHRVAVTGQGGPHLPPPVDFARWRPEENGTGSVAPETLAATGRREPDGVPGGLQVG